MLGGTKTLTELTGGLIPPNWKHYARSGGWITASNVINSIGGLLALVIFSRILDPSVYGQYRYILSLLGIVSVFSLVGMSNAISRAAAKGDTATFYYATKLRFRFSLIGSAILIILAFVQPQLSGLVLTAILVALLMPLISSLDSVVFLMYGVNNFRAGAIIRTLYNVFPALAAILAALIFSTSSSITLAHAVTAALVGVLCFVYVKTRIKAKNYSYENVKLGYHLSLQGALNHAFNHADKILLTMLVGFNELAIYLFAYAAVDIWRSYTKALSAIVLPQLSKRDDVSRRELMLYTFVALIVSAIVLLLSLPIVELLIPWIFTSTYAASIPIAQGLLISAIPWVSTLLLVAFLESQAAVKSLYLFRFSVPIMGILGYIILIPIQGVWGIVTTGIIVGWIGLVLLIYESLKRVGITSSS